jgi:hypothetical protein
MVLLPPRAFRACLIAAALALALPATAKIVTLKQTGRDIPFTVPDAWPVSQIPDGLQVKSPDGEVYVWFQATTPARLGAVIDDYFAYYKQQGVTFTGGMNESKGEIGGVAVSLMDPPATYQGEQTLVRFIFADAKPGVSKGLVIGTWASVKGDRLHDAPITHMITDILK